MLGAGNITVTSGRVDLLNNGFAGCHGFNHAKTIHKCGLGLLPGVICEGKKNDQGLISSPSLRSVELISLRQSCGGAVPLQPPLVMQFPLERVLGPIPRDAVRPSSWATAPWGWESGECYVPAHPGYPDQWPAKLHTGSFQLLDESAVSSKTETCSSGLSACKSVGGKGVCWQENISQAPLETQVIFSVLWLHICAITHPFSL